jgi:cytochrome P450
MCTVQYSLYLVLLRGVICKTFCTYVEVATFDTLYNLFFLNHVCLAISTRHESTILNTTILNFTTWCFLVLQSLPYLEAAILETLRLQPPAGLLVRSCTKEPMIE